MINPILSHLNNKKSNALIPPQMKQQIKNIADQLRSMQTPQGALNQMMLNNNPQLQNALKYIRENGGNPQAAFMNYARQMGIDPQQFLEQIKSSLS